MKQIPISERDFQKQVILLAQTLGYKVAHFRPGMNRRGQWQTAVAGDGAGFPDLTIVGRDQVLFVELKRVKGKLSDAQHDWLRAINTAGGDARVWTPDDWPEIEKTLNRRAERAA